MKNLLIRVFLLKLKTSMDLISLINQILKFLKSKKITSFLYWLPMDYGMNLMLWISRILSIKIEKIKLMSLMIYSNKLLKLQRKNAKERKKNLEICPLESEEATMMIFLLLLLILKINSQKNNNDNVLIILFISLTIILF